jgi:hypothetical protein
MAFGVASAAGLLAGFAGLLPRRCRVAVGDRFSTPILVDGLGYRLIGTEPVNVDPLVTVLIPAARLG